MKNVARAAVVLGMIASLACAWRLSVAYATEMDREDVRWFGMLFWGGLISAAVGTWGVLALRRLATKDWWLLPFEVVVLLSFVIHAYYFAHLRIGPVRTLGYAVGRTYLLWGMSREVPMEKRRE